MKRDLDLIRKILLDIEDQGETAALGGGFRNSLDDGSDSDTVHYHVQLMHDAGLIVADELVPGQWWPERITWEGHEFLDLARDETLWRRTTQQVESLTGGAPFQLVRERLARVMTAALSPRTRKK